jgi:hypothetical protein
MCQGFLAYNFAIMLKKIGILAIFIALLFGWPCVAEDNQGRAHAGHNAAQQAGEVVPPTIDTPIFSPCTQEKPCWEKDASAENPLPRWRRPEWVIVYVTVVYALLAWLQLRAIRKQAAIMERQVDTFINKERGRLTVEIEPFDMHGAKALGEVKIRVINHGSTKASIGRSVCLPCVESSEWKTADAESNLQMDLPKVISPNVEGAPFTAPIFQGGKLEFDSKKAIDDIQSGTMSLYVLGCIDYEDVFGGKWQLRFCRKWQSLVYAGGTALRHHSWPDHGGTEENYERQTKDPSKLTSFLARIRKFVSPRPKDPSPKTT